MLILDYFFFWDKPVINRPETNNGQKGAIVELFGWPYADIEQECKFLSKAGYMGLRIQSPNEHVMSDKWYEVDGNYNPWFVLSMLTLGTLLISQYLTVLLLAKELWQN